MTWRPHSDKQDRAVFSNSKILALLTGIQFGKTEVGAIRMKLRMHKFTDKDDAFIIAAPTYKIMQQSTLPAFLKIMEGEGEYNKVNATFTMRGGGTCYLRTATEPDSIVGITNVRGVWVDEAGKVSLYFWENVLARAAFRDCPIDITSSPYTLNWVFKNIVRPKQKGLKGYEDIHLIQAASWENPLFPKKSIDHAKATMDARRFNALFGGMWERLAGLVYDCFDETENIIAPFALPSDVKYYAGVDWGHTDPFVLVIHAVLPSGQRFQVSEVCKSSLLITDIIKICREKDAVFGIEHFYCDPSQPGYIEELCRNGLRASKANNDIRLGIDNLYEQIKTRTFKVFDGSSPHTIDEIDSYHYPELGELTVDEATKEQKPVGQNDHCMDAIRYCAIMTKSTVKRPSINPDEKKPEDQYARLERLKKKTSYSGGSEEWS